MQKTGALGASDRGVTKDSVLLGWLFPNQSSISYGRSLGMEVPSYGTANYVDPFVKEVNAAGGINGRKIDLKIVEWELTDSEDKMQAACIELAEDLKVFATVAYTGFYGDAEVCLADKQVPAITFTAASEDYLYRREKGWVHETVMTKDRMLKDMADWIMAAGIAKPSTKIGVSWTDTNEYNQVMNTVVLPYMKSKGLNVAKTFVYSTDYSQTPTETSAAVLQFKAAGVDLVIPVSNWFITIFFTQQADSQAYHPEYAVSDVGQLTFDVYAQLFQADQWDKVKGLTALRQGEPAAGKPLTPDQKTCLDVYTKNGGQEIKSYTDRDLALYGCEHIWLFTKVARLAGPEPTRTKFLAAFDTLGTYNERVTITDALTFRKGKYDGADRVAILQWRKDCKCYWQVEGFRLGRW